MFVHAKAAGGHQCLQMVEYQRIDGRVRHRVIATLGRLDELREGAD